MITRWGLEVPADLPWPEYPRPQLVRPEWSNLNGRWRFAFTDSPAVPERWEGEIVVPFSPETALSGVGRQLQPDEWLWYEREIDVDPTAVYGRLLLHFGAVDQRCTIWVGDVEVGAHVGGYLPFSCDVTDAVRAGGRTVRVRVRDLSETAPHARGKQRLDRGRLWYTAQSGIWQTVWLEPVPASYVASLHVRPDLDASAFEVTAVVVGEGDVEVVATAGGEVAGRAVGRADEVTRVPLSVHRAWSPADPFLYDLRVTLTGADGSHDEVTSYAGLRSVEIAPDPHGRPRIRLNGTEFPQIGVLDQGYWPDGLLTPPSDAAMVHDIETARDLGFTAMRKHAKIEPQRWYHHCDRIGMLVWQDMVNGGGRYRHLVTTLPARRPVRISDRRYAVYHRDDADGRAEFLDEVRQTVALLGDHPCIVVWTPFNEGWGQFDADDIAAEVRRLDPTRPVNAVSGWVDQGGGDIRSFHKYGDRWRVPRRDRRGRLVALTEYGGYGLRVDGHDWRPDRHADDDEYDYHHYDDAAALTEAFVRVHRDRLAPAVGLGLAATFYTQLTDVEDELNGLLTWDREVVKIPADVVRAALAALRAT